MEEIDEIAKIIQEGAQLKVNEDIKKAIRELKAIQRFERFSVRRKLRYAPIDS